METILQRPRLLLAPQLAGMDIENPIMGDVRYQLLNWEVLEARSWDGAPYSATFRMAKKNYTLTVTYNQQQFDGSNWANLNTGIPSRLISL